MDASALRIVKEIEVCISSTDFTRHDNFVDYIVSHNRIVLTGAGRVGLAMRTFAMRLMHLGFESHFLGDVTVPNLGKGDLLLIGSGSGETRSVVSSAEIGKSKGLNIALITSIASSSIGKLSDCEFILSAPNKQNSFNKLESIQPMTTLFEQTLQIYLDFLVLSIMETKNISSNEMWMRHNAIE